MIDSNKPKKSDHIVRYLQGHGAHNAGEIAGCTAGELPALTAKQRKTPHNPDGLPVAEEVKEVDGKIVTVASIKAAAAKAAAEAAKKTEPKPEAPKA